MYLYIILFLLVFITVITVVGHAIWVLLALIFRSMFGAHRKRKQRKHEPTSIVEERRKAIFWSVQHIEQLSREGRVESDAAQKVIQAICDKQAGFPPSPPREIQSIPPPPAEPLPKIGRAHV